MPQPARNELRDLVARIETLAAGHPAFSQACGVIANAMNHLSAMARLEEVAGGMIEASDATETDRIINAVALARRIYNSMALLPDFGSGSLSGNTIRIINNRGYRYKITVVEE